jgi:AcrR family transcriptional regulator
MPSDPPEILPEGVGRPGTERRILAETARLVARRGTHGASIREIAAGVGIRSSGLYEYFPSKDHIVAALVELGYRMQLETFTRVLADVPGDPVTQVRRIVVDLVDLFCRYSDVCVVAVDQLASLPEDLAAAPLAIRGEIQANMLRIILGGRESGAFDVRNPGMTAAALGSLLAWIPHWFEPGLSIDIGELGDVYATFALRILGAGDTAR